jgi:hypothetical protein
MNTMTKNSESLNNNPIDVVIAWVDGNDPLLTEKRNFYLKESGYKTHPGALPTFFASVNEIKYCVFSILTFAPFVRNIFIVTDEQDPNLYEDIKLYFPNKADSLRIVDHKEVFRGYEKYLPTFNSASLLALIWRIKGLSENFVYFNDDFFLIREIRPEDWFINNRPVLRGKWLLPPFKKMLGKYVNIVVNKYLYNNPDYMPRHSFYLRQWKSAFMTGMKIRYFFHCHTPFPLKRTRLETFFNENRELMEKTIASRFRSEEQVLLTSIAFHLEIRDGNRNIEKLNLGYFHPYYSKRKMKRRMLRCERDTRIKSICAQSLDMFSNEERNKILGWMDGILGSVTQK